MSKIIVPAVALPVYVVEEVSAKTGNPYRQLCVDVDDHYTLKKFASDEEVELVRMKLAKPAEPIV